MSSELSVASVAVKKCTLPALNRGAEYKYARASYIAVGPHINTVTQCTHRAELISARPDPASAVAAAPLPLLHIIERASKSSCCAYSGSPHQAHGETSGARRAATLLGGPRICTVKAAHRRPAAHNAALAGRG